MTAGMSRFHVIYMQPSTSTITEGVATGVGRISTKKRHIPKVPQATRLPEGQYAVERLISKRKKVCICYSYITVYRSRISLLLHDGPRRSRGGVLIRGPTTAVIYLASIFHDWVQQVQV